MDAVEEQHCSLQVAEAQEDWQRCQLKANYQLAVAVVDEIVRDPWCVQCLRNRLQERKQKARLPLLRKRRICQDLPHLAQARLGRDLLGLRIGFVLGEVAKTTHFDAESLHKHLHSETQLSGALRLKSDMLLNTALWQIFTNCPLARGQKVKDSRATGRLSEAGAVNSPSIRYSVNFKDGPLTVSNTVAPL